MRVERTAPSRDQVHELLLAAAEIARARTASIASSRLTELADRLRHRDFNIAVLGEFKRGKSTLVNAILGTPVLPTGVLPLTSVVTRVRWGEVPEAQIRFEDGTSTTIPPARLKRFVTEAGNPRNRLRVAAAEVAVPADLLRGGAVILDTPGVGSTFEHNTETTLRLLDDVDAAVFVTGSDPPISMEERAFFTRVNGHANKMFFVLNKIDVLDPSEVDAVQTFTRSAVDEAMGHGVEVFAVSARRAQHEGDEGLEVFVQALSAFIERDLAEVGTVSIARKASEVVAQLRASIAVELNALHLPVVEVAYRRDRLAAVRRDTEEVRAELEAVVAAEVVSLVEAIERELAGWRSAETDRLTTEAGRAIAEGLVRASDLDQHIKDLLRFDVEAWRSELEATFQSRFSAASARFVARADEAASSAVEAASGILDLELPAAPSLGGLIGESRFTYSFLEVPTVMQSLLPDAASVLPKREAGKVAIRRARQKIPMLVDRQSGRLRYDLVTRFEASARELVRSLDRHLAGTTEGLEAALARALGSAGSFEWTEDRTAPKLIALDEELFKVSDRLWDSVRPLQEGAR